MWFGDVGQECKKCITLSGQKNAGLRMPNLKKTRWWSLSGGEETDIKEVKIPTLSLQKPQRRDQASSMTLERLPACQPRGGHFQRWVGGGD